MGNLNTGRARNLRPRVRVLTLALLASLFPPGSHPSRALQARRKGRWDRIPPPSVATELPRGNGSHGAKRMGRLCGRNGGNLHCAHGLPFPQEARAAALLGSERPTPVLAGNKVSSLWLMRNTPPL